MNSALGIVPLLPDEAARVLALPRERVPLLQSIAALARLVGDDAARRQGAPPPTTKRAGVMHMRQAPAFTYAMLLENANQPAFKIGWAFDWEQRQRQFNHAALPHIGGVRYQIRLKQLWATAKEAFRMEQTLLREFDTNRHRYNSEVIVPLELQVLEAAWTRYIWNRRARRLQP